MPSHTEFRIGPGIGLCQTALPDLLRNTNRGFPVPGPGLLADLTVMMASSPEDVATRALELLLGRSSAARGAMNRLLCEWRSSGSGTPVVRWASQVVAIDRSRTDLEGFSETGASVAILENKFWAGLTENQPEGYLQRLSALDGVLAFVVPDSRVRIMTHEIELRLRALRGTPASVHWIGDTAVFSSLNHPVVTVVGWMTLLSSLASAMEGAKEYDNHADLRQLQALAQRMDIEGFRPFKASDITGDTPRLILRLGSVVDDAVQRLLTAPHINKKGLKASAGQGWYGHYLWIHGYGCQLVFTAHRWHTLGISPVWMRISGSDWKYPPGLGAPLRSAVPDEQWVFEQQGYGSGYWVAIRLLEHRERDVVIGDIVDQVGRVAAVLGAYPQRESEAPPPDTGG